MPRAAALANALADGIVTQLKTINAGPGVNLFGAAADADKWLTQPRTVRRGLTMDVLTLEDDPSLLVEIQRWFSVPEGGGGPHRLEITIAVHMKVTNNAGAENALNSLAADVAYVLSQNETLAAVSERMIETGALSYEPQTEIMLARGGLAFATMTAEYVLRYDHTLTSPP